MKNTIITIALATIGLSASAQQSPYVFADFTKGTVVQKGGVKADANVNYNTITQEMVFIQDNNKSVLDPSNVDSVIVQGKTFIPSGKAFFLRLTGTKVPLLEQIANNHQAAGLQAGTAMGGAVGSDNSAAPTTASADYDLKLKDGDSLVPDNKFWLQKDNKFEKAGDKKDFVKVFPDKEQAIDAFVKENNIDFKKADDLAKLTVFCNKQSSASL